MMEKEELEENLPLTANLIPFNQQLEEKIPLLPHILIIVSMKKK